MVLTIKPPGPTLTANLPLSQRLESSGLRCTKQRNHVFQVVAESHDHPTAEDIFERTRRRIPEISFATVYNSLAALVQCGLVRQVTLEKSPARFCPNMREHCHFLCELCGGVTDVDLPGGDGLGMRLPLGYTISGLDISLRGRCPKCQGPGNANLAHSNNIASP
jgi:Fe2+ or Zn2+ uptake regulation protein